MRGGDIEGVRNLWNRVAADWRIQVGDVENRDVLDAGCGTGYLTRQLRDRGARVFGVDLSDR